MEKNRGELCYTQWTWVCTTAKGTDLLVFTVVLTADKRSSRNSKVYRALLSDQIQSDAAKHRAFFKAEGWDLTVESVTHLSSRFTS